MALEVFTFPGSSNLASGSYDTESCELIIYFTSGSTYSYKDVPQAIKDGLLKAPSAGGYFAQNIRNSFPYEQI